MKNETEKAKKQHRFAEAANLHAIEGQPLSAEQIAMFDMFEREGWSEEQCLAYIRAKYSELARPGVAAE